MNQEKFFKNLAVRLLDDYTGIANRGIPDGAYYALLDLAGLIEVDIRQLDAAVKENNGRFYLPENHRLQDWKIKTCHQDWKIKRE